MDDLESGRVDILYVGRQTRVLYNLGGKWTAVLIESAAGAALAAWG